MVEQVTYSKGKFSQIKLSEGGRFFVEVLPDKILVRRIIFGLFPREILWEFEFPFYIRTAIESWETSNEVLDLVLKSISKSKNRRELLETLERKTFGELSSWVEKNQKGAEEISFDKVGVYGFKKSKG